MTITQEQIDIMFTPDKGTFSHFMAKEIFDQPAVIAHYLAQHLKSKTEAAVFPQLDALPVPTRLRILACGTSFHAGFWSRYFFEHWAGIPTEVEIASEYRHRSPRFSPDETIIVITQSGETADTLDAMRLAKKAGCQIIGFSNVEGSSIAKESTAVVYTQAGPEISVASTKALISQLAALLCTSFYWGTRNNTLDSTQRQAIVKELHLLPEALKTSLPHIQEKAKELAEKLRNMEDCYVAGRAQNFPLALEGALKLKETSYVHAEGLSLGELRHGPLALVDHNFPTLIIMPHDALFEKNRVGAEEIYNQGGATIVLTTDQANTTAVKGTYHWEIPHVWEPLQAFLVLPALQLFSYHVATLRGRDVDNPRNLTKSVSE